jgi:hypothetical protein
MFVVDVSANGDDLGGCLVPPLTNRCDLCPAPDHLERVFLCRALECVEYALASVSHPPICAVMGWDDYVRMNSAIAS